MLPSLGLKYVLYLDILNIAEALKNVQINFSLGSR
jgi:hypothetical protein